MNDVAEVSTVQAWSLQHLSLESLAAIAAASGVIAFALTPGIDLAVARLFYVGDRHFVGEGAKVVQLVRFALLAAYVVASAAVVVGLIVARMHPRGWLSLTFAQWLFLALSLGVGPGVVANLALKDQSGRARPGQIMEFGGTKQFSAAFEPSEQCVRNCSFVSGEASSMFVMFFAAACVWRRRWRALTLGGMAAGSLAGLIRMMQGAHFLTDVVFAGVFMAMTVAVIQFIFDAIAASARTDGQAASGRRLSAS